MSRLVTVSALVLAVVAMVFLALWPPSRSNPRHGQREEGVPIPSAQERQPPGPASPAIPSRPVAPPRGGGSPGEGAPAQPASPGRLAEASRDPAASGLRVLVRDGAGGPVESARVQIRSLGEGAAVPLLDEVAGPDGQVELAVLPQGRAVVVASSGETRRSATVNLVEGRVTELTVQFRKGGTVAGEVSHAERGPLAGAVLELGRGDDEGFTDQRTVTADGAGRYSLEDAPPGTYVVTLQHRPTGVFLYHRFELVVPETGRATQDFRIGLGSIEGTVLDQATRQPLAGASLSIGEPFYTHASTDARGRFRFFDVPPGSYDLVASREGYEMKVVKRVSADPAAPGPIEILLAPAVALELVLTDSEGAPVAGEVVLGMFEVGGKSSWSLNLRTDGEGRLKYARALPGTYEVRVTALGFLPASLRVEIGLSGAQAALRLEREAPAAEAPLRGIVREAVTRRPIAGVSVRVDNVMGAETMTATDGTFAVAKVPPGRHRLWVSKEGWVILHLTEVEVRKEKPSTLELEMEPAATLHLRICSRRGEPVSGRVILGFVSLDSERPWRLGTGVSADPEGHAVYRQAPPGSFELRVSAEEAGAKLQRVDLAPGENWVDVRLE